MPLTKKQTLIIILSVVVILIALMFLVYGKQLQELIRGGKAPSEKIEKVEKKEGKEIEVVVEENPSDKTKTDVFLKDKRIGQETLFITLSDVDIDYYHPAEYHNGNLYIIRRASEEIDEIWRYNQQKQGEKLYAGRWFGFRVKDDEKVITITTAEEFNLLDNNGNKIKTFKADEVLVSPAGPQFEVVAWAPNAVWLDNTFGPNLTGLVKIDTSAFTIVKYDLSHLPAGTEYAFNVKKEKVAFSNYPAFFEVESLEEYERSGSKVNLIVYDLQTKAQGQIATSIAKKFEPAWIDENTLEYNNPSGEGKITKQTP